MEIKDIAIALAKANRHPDPEGYAEAAVRAANGEEAYPEEAAAREAAAKAQAEADAEIAAQAAENK